LDGALRRRRSRSQVESPSASCLSRPRQNTDRGAAGSVTDDHLREMIHSTAVHAHHRWAMASMRKQFAARAPHEDDDGVTRLTRSQDPHGPRQCNSRARTRSCPVCRLRLARPEFRHTRSAGSRSETPRVPSGEPARPFLGGAASRWRIAGPPSSLRRTAITRTGAPPLGPASMPSEPG
jgi:hypothetical protein